MNRGLERRAIFRDDKDFTDFLSLLSDIHARWRLEVHAYSLMPNHYHLLVRTPEPNLSRCMRHLNGVFTQAFNVRHRRDGPLFRGRFKAILVEEENYLLELVRYIHLNPVRAGLVERPEQHRWTSHAFYCRPRREMGPLQTEYVLSCFGSNAGRARRELRRFVQAGVSDDVAKVFSRSSLPAVLGSEGFKEWVRYNFLDERKATADVPQLAQEKRPHGLQPLLKAVCEVCGCSRGELKRSYKGRENEGRALAMYAMWNALGMKQRSIARAVGGVTSAGVAKAVQRFQERLAADEALRERLRIVRDRSKLSHVKT